MDKVNSIAMAILAYGLLAGAAWGQDTKAVWGTVEDVNFKNFVGVQTSPFFGRANSANPARQLQVSMKFHL